MPNENGFVNVIAGKFNEVSGPAKTYSPVNLFDIKLKKNGEINTTIPLNHNTAMLVVNGSVEVNAEKATEHSFVLFKNDGEEINIKANEDSVLLLLSGEPINEPIVSYGPFVMNTEQEIHEAIRDFQSGKFGVLA
ncbi:MAG: pirin family protein [Chitinophagaceae bacterium]